MRYIAAAVLFVAGTAQATDICIAVPTAAVVRVVNAFAVQYNYPATVPNTSPTPASPGDPGATPTPAMVANPQTKAAFARQKLAQYVKDVLVAAESGAAADSARKTAGDSAGGVVVE